MKPLPLLPLLLLASCATTSYPAAPMGAGARKITFFYGEREMDDDDAYKPLEDQDAYGAALSWEPERGGLGGEVGVMIAGDDDEISGFDVDVDSLEIFGGVRQNFGAEALRPYIGGGISWIDTEAEVAFGGQSADVEDDSFGLYLHAGIDAWVQESVSIGIEYRVLLGTELDFEGVDTDADYGQVSLTLGFSF